uniref:ADP-ribosylation factor interacting protein 1 (arfaptin 1) n=1 Tax=Haplochromis burtoni TaxID=8153 RepID=A0A3Q2XD70_HAPBU
MSEVSLEAESGKTSSEEPQMDCEEDGKAEESLSKELKQESVDSSSVREEDVMYDIDINSDEENAESSNRKGQKPHDEGIQSETLASGRVADRGHETKRSVETAETPQESGDTHTETKESTMAEESHRSTAAEIPVTSNGELEQSPESVFSRDSYPSGPGAINLSETCVTSSNFASTTEGIIESGPYKGSMTAQPKSGAVVLSEDLKNPAMEKLDLVRKWSINTYKCTRQILSEKLGRGSRTVDLELEAQIEVLRDNKRKYQHVIKLAQMLASQLSQIMQTQRQLGDAFADLSLKTPELHNPSYYKNCDILLGHICYLEELNLGPRDANTVPKIEVSQQQFQTHREKYERMRNDVSVKLKFLEENKVKVLHNQLILFHNAIAAYYAGNQQQLEQTLKQFHIKLKMPGEDSPSWLEEH